MIKRQNICIVCKINYYIITCNFTGRSFDLFVFRSFELGNPTQKTLVKNDKKLSFLTKRSLSFDRKTAIFSVWKPFDSSKWENVWKMNCLTPTWFEHAAFWSGVRRATVAPRSLVEVKTILYYFCQGNLLTMSNFLRVRSFSEAIEHLFIQRYLRVWC